MKDNTPKRPYFGPYFPNFAPYSSNFAPYWGCPGHPLAPFFVAPMAVVNVDITLLSIIHFYNLEIKLNLICLVRLKQF